MRPVVGMRPLLLPCAMAAGLAAFLLHPGVRVEPAAFWTIAAAAAGILAWTGWLFASRRESGEDLRLELVIRTPHWMQTLAQGALLVWWGTFVNMVQLWAPMIVAQLLLAVAVEGLFALTRRGRYAAGLGVVPVIFSVNLFLWFTGPWFFFQFAMVVLVYAGKEFIRWQLDGRSRHIFNPSALALSVAAVLLIATGSTEITLGIEIAQSQFIPPQMYLVIFLAAVPAQLLFGVAMMTMPAVLTILGFGLLYQSLTGIYFFYDAYIPVSVFLGLHLLFTDPATSPRSDGGRILFGLIYGTGVVTSAAMLDAIGAPNFYDKLLPVPILNVLAPRLDRTANWFGEKLSVVGRLQLPGGARRRVATVALWGAAFATMSAAGGVGDHHPGQYFPYWRDACEAGSDRACNYSGVMLQNFCDQGSGWGCNEFGVLLVALDRNFVGAAGEFERSCRFEYGPGCGNLQMLAGGDERLAQGPGAFEREDPPLAELPIVLSGSKGPVTERDPEALRALGCERGWRELGCT
ncbi:MAG: hypothetical protein F4106_05770 [Gemmatimonadetes bacterium]|nr:hypothetical protein [Gemmatimonadota bacterium]MYC90877.1 hypothetical protein [Gemmatimonadota bacterium]MYG35853.1 hypothetical protein [Gemmatimonadota bacterium]MYJ17544.1 hypothetical protein [Gemmatimonadota bacterium]